MNIARKLVGLAGAAVRVWGAYLKAGRGIPDRGEIWSAKLPMPDAP